jgi:hypothetical protein
MSLPWLLWAQDAFFAMMTAIIVIALIACGLLLLIACCINLADDSWLHKLTAPLWDSDLRLVRIAIGLGSLTWACVLLFDGPQFDRPAYYWLARLAGQRFWGAAFLIVGTLQAARAFFNVPISHGIYACVAAAAICFLWSCVTFSLALALDPTPAINSGNIVLTLLSMLVLIRAIARHG